MKKLIYGSLFFALVGIVFVGCKKEIIPTETSYSNGNTSVTVKSAQLDKISEFESIGIEHNEGLIFTYNYLEVNGKPGEMTREEIKSLAKEGVLKFLAIHLDTNGLNYLNNFADSVFANESFSSSVDLSELTIGHNVSSELNNLLEDLNFICDSYNAETHMQSIEDLESYSLDILNDDEVIVFLSATSVAKATFDYWHEHQNEWLLLIGNLEKASPKAVAKADVGGAVAGVLTYWWLGGPIGWGGSALGGACIASAAAVFS